MNRRKFLGITGGVIIAAGGTGYLFSDKNNFTRSDMKIDMNGSLHMLPDETQILYLASLAPSGHNTQPWSIQYLAPYHWIICNDKTKWLPAVDPAQRETILSIGAFIQNMEYASANYGYTCQFNLLAANNQDEKILEVKLIKATLPGYDINKLRSRRTVRSGFLDDVLKKEDISHLIAGETDFLHFIHRDTPEYKWLNEQTIEANRIQAYRDPAQQELSEWIRFSSHDAKKNCDGLTTAGMELDGIPGWILRNFYNKQDVMTRKFRDQGITKVVNQVSHSAGWLVISTADDSVNGLLETGRRMQRIFLKIRERQIAMHPMTQILEEAETRQKVNASLGITNPIQFLLRIGYLKNYPDPVSLRRPVSRFVRK